MFEGCRALILALRGLLYVLQDVIGYSFFFVSGLHRTFGFPRLQNPWGSNTILVFSDSGSGVVRDVGFWL